MGSISSRPTAPPIQTVAAPSVSVTPSTISTVTTASATEVEQTSEAARVEEREQSLLRRNRGVLGTILTGFQGVLSPNQTQSSSRKTLLGE